jgi:hypothetical protein
LALSRLDKARFTDRTAAVLIRLPLLLIFAIAFAVTAIFVRSVHQYSVMPDELGYVKQSLEIARTGFLVGQHGFYFSSWGQLLPLISAPIFGLLSMAHAFYAAHTFYAFLLASTAFPAYLIARELRLGRLAALPVAALSVGVPWLVIAGEVMTDVVAYPVFVWATFAMLRTLIAPSARRDMVALVAILLAFFARTQFLVLGPVLLLATVVYELLLSLSTRGNGAVGASVRVGLRHAFDRHRVLWLVSALVVVGVVAIAIRGSAQSVFGFYVAPLQGNLLPPATFSAGIEQLEGVALGVGVVPLTLATAWTLATLARPREPARLAFAVLLVLIVPVLLVMVGSFQARFLGPATTDRYLFYLAPLLFAGAVAWIADRRASFVFTLLVALAVSWMVLGVSLQYLPVASTINPSYNIHRVFVGQAYRLARLLGLGHLDARVPIALITLTFTLLAVQLRRRLSTAKALLAVTLPILAYGLLNTGYTMVKVQEQYAIVPPSHAAQMAWIDRAVPRNAAVGLLLNRITTGPNQWLNWDLWWDLSFWNKTVQRVFVFPGQSTLAQGFVADLGQDLVHGQLTGLMGANYLVKLVSDARIGPRAPVVRLNGGLVLYKLAARAPLVFGTNGVGDIGSLVPGTHPFIRLFGDGGLTPVRERVVIALDVTSTRPDCPCHLHLGSGYGDAAVPSGMTKQQPYTRVIRTVTVPARGFIQLNLATTSRRRQSANAWMSVVFVHVTPERHAT